MDQTSNSNEVVNQISSSDGDIPIFRVRSVEETEAAHDLLSLSQSLPPLPAPSVITIHHPTPIYPITTNVQNMEPAYNYRPYSPKTLITPNYRTTSPIPVVIPCYQPSNFNHPNTSEEPSNSIPTPPNSECSSDAENNSPNNQQDRISKSDENHDEKNKKSTHYTYDALLVADGRSKKREKREKTPIEKEIPEEKEIQAKNEVSVIKETAKEKSKHNR